MTNTFETVYRLICNGYGAINYIRDLMLDIDGMDDDFGAVFGDFFQIAYYQPIMLKSYEFRAVFEILAEHASDWLDDQEVHLDVDEPLGCSTWQVLYMTKRLADDGLKSALLKLYDELLFYDKEWEIAEAEAILTEDYGIRHTDFIDFGKHNGLNL